MNNKNNFQDFTNLYELSKTLRFELKPVWETERLISENWLKERDELRDIDYDIIKPIFDQLHDRFIRKSLEWISVDWENLANSTKKYKKDKKKIDEEIKVANDKESEKLYTKRKKLEEEQDKRLEEVRKEITKNYLITAKNWKDTWWEEIIEQTKQWYKMRANILKVLKKTFSDIHEIEKLINENGKALEMLWKKFEYYIRKIEVEDDFSWWKKLYIWEKQEAVEENFDKPTAKKYLEEILSRIKEKNIEEIQKQVLELIKNFEWFWTYFWWFNTNRENYYSSEEKTTWVANRIVNQNFTFFVSNLELKSKIKISLTQEESKIFEVNNYNLYLSQDWIDTYNEIIWWKKDKNWVRISDWINQKLNEYTQKHNEKKIQLQPLYKQIWSVKAKSIPFEIIETPEDFKWILDTIIDASKENIPKIVEKLKNIFESDKLDTMYISKNNLTFISNRYFSNWYTVSEKWAELKIFKKKKSREEWDDFQVPKYISLQELKNILEKIEFVDNAWVDEDKRIYFFKKHFEEKRNWVTDNWEFFKKIFRDDIDKLYSWENEEISIDETDEKITLKSFLTSLEEIEKILSDFNRKDKEQRKVLKAFADKTIFIFQFLKLFKVDKEKIDWELWDFYEFYDEMIEKFLITKHYDTIRNYLTKKDFSEEKIKLNFNCWYLLTWWDSDFSTYWTLIFKRDRKFYIWIINWTWLSREEIDILKDWITQENIAEKMILESQKIDNKNPPRWFIRSKWDTFSPMVREWLLDPNKMVEVNWEKLSILDIYDKDLFIKKKDDASYKKYLFHLIEYFKDWFRKHKDFINFRDNFSKWSDSNSYNSVADFYNETADLCYFLKWENINFNNLLELNKSNKIFLYQIYSKDFSNKSSWNKNTQTKLFLDLMKTENNKFLKLLWQWEIFFRSSSLEEKQEIVTKNNNKIIKSLNNPIHNKRYASDKTLLHFPINIKWRNLKEWFNTFLNKKIAQKDFYQSLHIIWIDRWEKHLAFYSIINAETGKIIEQWSLNIVNGINYEKLLTERAWNRLKARQEWETIWNIKNLKKWYISHVVKKISDLVLQYNWIVVMEKLNKWFKQWRQKIEQSVYQNLEIDLAKKLSYLVLKNKEEWEWSITMPYQLCPFAKNYSDIENSKQWWIMFYTTAAYTSVTDPVTWWRKSTYLKKWRLEDMRSQIIDTFREIWFDESKRAYFFKLHWSKWTLYSWCERYRGKQNKAWRWEINEIFTTQELDKLFQAHWIDTNRDIVCQIEEKGDLLSKFYETFIWIFDVICQIRNTSKEKEDFIASPVEPFFDSRKYFEKLPELNWEKFETENNLEFPTSGDANWAYNIARKWLIMLKKIHKNPKIKPDKLFISNDEWDLIASNWENFSHQ